MSKLERWLTLVANLSVVAGIVFLAAEMRQNTEMMRAQIRDSITGKQMEYQIAVATTPELADVVARAADGLDAGQERLMFNFITEAIFREWENSYYQYERGLFSAEEFEARRATWRANMARPAPHAVWLQVRNAYSPDFRAEIDRIVAEVGQAQ